MQWLNRILFIEVWKSTFDQSDRLTVSRDSLRRTAERKINIQCHAPYLDTPLSWQNAPYLDKILEISESKRPIPLSPIPLYPIRGMAL